MRVVEVGLALFAIVAAGIAGPACSGDGPRAVVRRARRRPGTSTSGGIEPGKIDDRALLWIDVDGHDAADIDAVARAVALEPRLPDRGLAALTATSRASVRLPDRVRWSSPRRSTATAPNGDAESLVRRGLDVVVGRRMSPSSRSTMAGSPPSADFDEQVRGERDLGLLDAGAFMAGLLDAVLATYLGEVEDIEREIEKLDQVALRQSASHNELPGPRGASSAGGSPSCDAGWPPTATRSPR